MSEVVIRTENLFYKYATRSEYALLDVNLQIEKGEFVAIIGQNGSGKTTLVKHFNGLLKPERGKVIVEGRETTGIPTSELARSIGYVFPKPGSSDFCRFDKRRNCVWAKKPGI